MNSLHKADMINHIMERVHPWAAVRFHDVYDNGFLISAGSRLYIVEKPEGSADYSVEAVHPTPPEFAKKLEHELNGLVRDDAGNMIRRGRGGAMAKKSSRLSRSSTKRRPALLPSEISNGGFARSR